MAALFLFILLLLPGCGRDEPVTTYRIPKEAAESPMPMPNEPASPSRGGMHWKVPAGWVEQAPSQMRVGSFLVHGKDGQKADMSIVPLAGEAGGDLPNINRWRGQIGLSPIDQAEFGRESHWITPAGRRMLLVEFANQNKRIVAAVYRQGDTSWFFKLMGDDATVSNAKSAFLEFLETVSFPS